jgi:hypothetical protein
MTRVYQLLHIATTAAACAHDAPPLVDGLRLHLAHAPLDCIVMQIGARQQSYVGTTGCAGCPHDRCDPGCPMALLRRTLTQALPSTATRLTRGSLATRPYTRAVLATPLRTAQALTAAHLGGWPEARLTVSWLRMRRSQRRVAALLAVGADGPDPAAHLRMLGWQPWPLSQRLAQAVVRLPVAGHAPRTLDPTLVLPSGLLNDPLHTNTESLEPSLTPEQDAALADWLHAIQHGTPEAVTDTRVLADTAHESIWPSGPHGLPPAALATLVAQILAEPSFQSTRKGQSGISKGRLVGLKHPALTEPIARALMVWFDRADVLAAPEHGQSPWRAPRPFALTDCDQIAGRLRGTPLPTNDETRAAYGGDR